MTRKEFKRIAQALNKVAAANLRSSGSARQFMRSAGILLRVQSEDTTRMTIVSSTSAEGWMIIAKGDWKRESR